MISLEKIKYIYKNLPDKKIYLEFVTALLTIPVLLTVIIINLNNLNNKNQTQPQKQEKQNVTIVPIEVKDNQNTKTPSTTPSPAQCKKEVGPVEINYPDENQAVEKNPVCIDISLQKDDYCASVWSYRINNSDWSDYTDKSICLYNLDSGNKKLDLKVKSIASGDEKVITRNFIYQNSNSPTPTPIPSLSPTPIATNSASLK